ncbi:MAG: M28 family metallopeptidase [Bryobacteraceae bacterium]|nr:M28 family metallopeptidase [Bryobacteraceae bacterium]
MKRVLPAVLTLVCAAWSIFGAPPVEVSEAGRAWWAHVAYLADDALEGRKAGSEGHRKAAQYVASEFEKAGLKPAGTRGYLQPVAFRLRQIVEKESSLEFIGPNGKVESVTQGKDALLASRGISGRVVDAGIVFVGQGLVIPEAGVDDLKGLDLKGKIALVLKGLPKGVSPALGSHAGSAAEQWKVLSAAGAVGMASLFNPGRADIPWERTALSRLTPTIGLADPSLNETASQQVGLTLHPSAANRLLAGTGHTAEELLAIDKAGQPLPKFPLLYRVRAKATFTEKTAESENVLGMIPGSDPILKNEYVVYSAHLDHLGIGPAVPSDPADTIYNGAMDNASGIASMIEIAKGLRGRQLKRSIIFAAVTGEEGGLLGSKYFANRPTVPRGQLVADLNTDMFLPIIPLRAITVLGLDESDLGPEFAAVAKRFGLPAERDPEPARGRFTRSDQYSFIRNGVPSLAFKFHAEPNTPEGQILAKWTKERYHAPSDDLKQPVSIDGAVRFNEVMAAFLDDLAERPSRPKWNDSSFFKRFAQ